MAQRWHPNTTVACVVEREGRFLMVEERDKRTGAMVFNQPAGHLEQGESLQDAALRETLEETGWTVNLTGIISIALYDAPTNGLTYHRTTFCADPVSQAEDATIDPDIHCVHWLDYGEIVAISDRLRSPLVLTTLDAYRLGRRYPLDLIDPP